MWVYLSNLNITRYIDINENLRVHDLVKICLSGQHINSISTDLDLPNLKECDISFNCLEKFPNSKFMKNIKILNISSNNIQLIHIQETLSKLEELDISWNCISSCLTNIKILKTYVPNLLKLKICNNPFEDIDPELTEYILHMNILSLQFINDNLCTNLHLPENYFPCSFNMYNLRQHNNSIYLEENIIKSEEEADLLLTEKNIKCAKSIHISQESFVLMHILKKALKIQELCVTCCLLTTLCIKMPLKHLIKLNLGNNLISTLNELTQTNFPLLKYLDLTNNLITTLEPMGSFCTLQEFYCSNNKIGDLLQIDNIKTWQMLHVIDLSNNPIHKRALYKKFIICHLNNIKYISGERIQYSDVAEARYIFDNRLDKYILNTIYKTDQLTTIIQLSITNCSLSKINLSGNLLPQLESLDLSNNQITYLWGLHSFQYLHTLCLSYNCLDTFDSNGYEKKQCIFPKLCTLLLDHNCIKSLMNINEKLPVIKHLFLNNNHLQSINGNILHTEIILKFLHIIYCYYKYIYIHFIGVSHCSSLESLILDYNDINTVTLENFLENNNLKFLSLENNKIKSLKFIKQLPQLEKLYIANNCLTNDTEMQHLLSLENLVELTFEGNRLYTEENKNKMMAQYFELTNLETAEI
ncbi:uncharacterized protein LOC116431727 isoform X3 [Nomia melanderi]|uniref:uncharacterized protein LOC116431727 isoform X3 n=1 Tax=Nomia melanderi TaxID=2448451 RepID=UPI003FCE312A